MSKMLTSKEVIDLIEQQYNTQIWRVCMVGEMSDIDETEYKEIMIGIYEKRNLPHMQKLLKDVLNVKDIRYTGHAKPLYH